MGLLSMELLFLEFWFKEWILGLLEGDEVTIDSVELEMVETDKENFEQGLKEIRV